MSAVSIEMNFMLKKRQVGPTSRPKVATPIKFSNSHAHPTTQIREPLKAEKAKSKLPPFFLSFPSCHLTGAYISLADVDHVLSDALR